MAFVIAIRIATFSDRHCELNGVASVSYGGSPTTVALNNSFSESWLLERGISAL